MRHAAMTTVRHAVSAAAILAAYTLLAAPSAAQERYPARAVTMIVPFAAGGTSDVIARIVAEEMGKALGQRIVNENVPGAGGSTALSRAARAAPDGYTIVIGNAGTSAAAYALYPDLKFTPDSFAPIGLAAKTFGLIALRKDFPARNPAEFLAYGKANPGKVSLGHAGVGSSNFLICKSFVQASGLDVTLVSYRGGGPALNDLMGGQIDGVCDAAASISGPIQSGNVKGLVVAGNARIASLPDIPDAMEAGLPDFQAQGWNALFAPRGTPAPVIATLNAALRTALASGALQKRMAELGSAAASGEELTPDYVARLIPGEVEKFRKLLAGTVVQ